MPIRASVMTAPGAPLELWELDDPEVEAGGVLLETVASEVCGTDVHLHHGRLAGVPYPIVPGHVSVGRVLEAPGVTHDALGEPLAPGDVVTFLDVHEVCNACWHCLVARQPNRCPSRKVYGITYSAHDGPFGGWAERIYLQPGVRVLKLTGGLDADDVIGGGCGLFTGFAAADRAGIRMGDTVLVQGSGPVGLAAAAFAALAGAVRVHMIGAPEARLALAADLGVDARWDVTATTRQERADAILSLTGGSSRRRGTPRPSRRRSTWCATAARTSWPGTTRTWARPPSIPIPTSTGSTWTSGGSGARTSTTWPGPWRCSPATATGCRSAGSWGGATAWSGRTRRWPTWRRCG